MSGAITKTLQAAQRAVFGLCGDQEQVTIRRYHGGPSSESVVSGQQPRKRIGAPIVCSAIFTRQEGGDAQRIKTILIQPESFAALATGEILDPAAHWTVETIGGLEQPLTANLGGGRTWRMMGPEANRPVLWSASVAEGGEYRTTGRFAGPAAGRA